jgi:soluble lytic murein transglycosylase-like protein
MPNPFVEEPAPPCEVDHRALVEAELSAYIVDFLAPIRRSRQYRRRLSAALKNVPVILDLVEADMTRHEFGHLDPLDPLLIGVVISFESAWDYTAIGPLGERGFMQVYSRPARGGFSDRELAKPENQLAAGIRFLRRAIDMCRGDLPGALTLYQTGRACRPLARAVKRRWRTYQKALKLYRKEKNHEKTKGCESTEGQQTQNP